MVDVFRQFRVLPEEPFFSAAYCTTTFSASCDFVDFLRDPLTGATNPCRIAFLVGQTPYIFDLAKPCKHLFILFVNGVSFLHAKKLDHVSMGTMAAFAGHGSRYCGFDVAVAEV